jgi:hypothetical protein
MTAILTWESSAIIASTMFMAEPVPIEIRSYSLFILPKNDLLFALLSYSLWIFGSAQK